MPSRRLVAGAAALSVVLLACGARGEGAAAPARARLLLPACDPQPFGAEALVSALRLELLAEGVELGPVSDADEVAGPPAIVVVDAPSCSAAEVVVRVEHAGSGRSASSTLDLEDRPAEDRARVLALSIAELLRTAWPGLVTPPAPAEPTPPPLAAVDRPRTTARPTSAGEIAGAEAFRILGTRVPADEEPGPPWRLGGLVSAALYPRFGGSFFGGGLAAALRLAPRLPIWLDIEGLYRWGGGTDPAGVVETHLATAALSVLVAASVGRLLASLGPEVELGWAWASGHPHDLGVEARSVDGFVLTVAARFALWIPLARGLAGTVDVAAGWAVVGVAPRVLGHAVGGVSGPMVGLDLGLAYEP